VATLRREGGRMRKRGAGGRGMEEAMEGGKQGGDEEKSYRQCTGAGSTFVYTACGS
jgi:hypothetical protein